MFAYNAAGINPEAADGVFITPDGENMLWNLLVLSGAVSMALTIVPMLFYKLTEKRQAQMVAEVEQRRAAQKTGQEK